MNEPQAVAVNDALNHLLRQKGHLADYVSALAFLADCAHRVTGTDWTGDQVIATILGTTQPLPPRPPRAPTPTRGASR